MPNCPICGRYYKSHQAVWSHLHGAHQGYLNTTLVEVTAAIRYALFERETLSADRLQREARKKLKEIFLKDVKPRDFKKLFDDAVKFLERMGHVTKYLNVKGGYSYGLTSQGRKAVRNNLSRQEGLIF